MASVALLSNPRSTGNKSLLPQIRSYCAHNPDIFHYEVEEVGQIGDALRSIACVKPKVLVINGGDGTVQAALTELHHGGHFGDSLPPVAVLPNGKTNLIALDLGSRGDPLTALDRIVALSKSDMQPHLVARELIALQQGDGGRSTLGMFLGGAGLADSILYCRHKIYPLGLPNGVSHVLTALALLLSAMFGIRGSFMPPRSRPVRISLTRDGQLQGHFSLLIVTTLERMLLASNAGSVAGAAANAGQLKLMAVDQSPLAILRGIFAGVFGKLGKQHFTGVHVERGDRVRIEGNCTSVILDGEIFEADHGRPITLTSTPPMAFLRLAA